jgi:hypothetical protein
MENGNAAPDAGKLNWLITDFFLKIIQQKMVGIAFAKNVEIKKLKR